MQPANHQASVFATDGFLVLRGVLDAQTCAMARRDIRAALDPVVGPAEYEADVGYPGAPGTRDAEGGQTPRRLLHAIARSEVLRALALDETVADSLRAVMGTTHIQLSQCHHNCVMTKHPGFSSATLWHQDIRYWSFDRPELVSAWFALGAETRKNGALKVIPGSHRLSLGRGRLDRDLFLRPELEENRALIHQAIPVELEQGDVLLFHCRLFHAAGKNLSDQVKLTPVFTYHEATNRAIPGTRSDQLPSIDVSQDLSVPNSHD